MDASWCFHYVSLSLIFVDGITRSPLFLYLFDTNAPLHHNMSMRLSVNLEPDVYALAKSLAKADDVSVSAVINRQLRDSFFGVKDTTFVKNGLLVSRSKIQITRAMVQQVSEDDE